MAFFVHTSRILGLYRICPKHQGKGGNHPFNHSFTSNSNHSRTSRHLVAVRHLSLPRNYFKLQRIYLPGCYSTRIIVWYIFELHFDCWWNFTCYWCFLLLLNYGFELASTITLVLQTHWPAKWVRRPKQIWQSHFTFMC